MCPACDLQDVGDACLQQHAWWEQHASKLEGVLLEQRERAATAEEKLEQLEAQLHGLRQQQEAQQALQQEQQLDQQGRQEQQEQVAEGANTETRSGRRQAAARANGSPADPEALAAAHRELGTLRTAALQECGRLRLQLAAAHLQRQQKDQEWRELVQAHAATVQQVKERVQAQQATAPPQQQAAPPQEQRQQAQQRQQQHAAAVPECPDYLGLMVQLQEREGELAEAQRGEREARGDACFNDDA